MPVLVENLTKYHRSEVIERARTWRHDHIEKIVDRMKLEHTTSSEAPKGAVIFDPSRWSGSNWLWFRTVM